MCWHYTALSGRCNVSITRRIVNAERKTKRKEWWYYSSSSNDCVCTTLLFFLFLPLFFLLPSYWSFLSSHTHRLCIYAFSLSPSLLSLTHICTGFLWWRPCTYVVTLLLLLLFFITRTTNEEEKKVKIEDGGYIHCLAWNKATPHIYCVLKKRYNGLKISFFTKYVKSLWTVIE